MNGPAVLQGKPHPAFAPMLPLAAEILPDSDLDAPPLNATRAKRGRKRAARAPASDKSNASAPTRRRQAAAKRAKKAEVSQTKQ